MFMHLLFVLFVKIALGDSAIVRINNVNEFIDFSKVVNSGTDDYSGTTVYLDSDLSFSDKTLEPIGLNDTYHFLGVFDGQGHIISNLKMNTNSQFTGLFGYSRRLTIRNVALDSSCSITSSYSGSDYACVGGIIGRCDPSNKACNIENSVNMANVTFSEGISCSSLIIGGIAGWLWPSYYPAYVKNCANYGSVTQSGISMWSFIGGIVGCLYGSSQSYTYIYNCLNYGTITHNGISSNALHLGGIVGESYYACIENCASAGEIFTPTKPSKSHIGGIVGYVYSNTYITHCYYTTDVGVNIVYGYGTPTSETDTPHSTTIINLTLIAKLNNYATNNSTWNKWLFNENNASVSFIINYEKSLTVNSQIILLPDLANSSERNFSGWYTDADLTTLFNLSQVESNTTLYGMFCGSLNYTVTLDVNGGNELGENEMIVGCMSYYGPFPKIVTRTGHTFTGWSTEKEGGDKVETGDKVKTLNNHTLYARWVINNYTVTFDVNGGNNLSVTSMTVTFDNQYGPLPIPTKEGHMFLGWFTESNASVKNETVVIIADNHTLHAHWEKVTTQVEIVFNTKDLSREEVEEFVKKYTDAKFTITEFEGESGEIRVIVKFADNEEAKGFVETIRESSEMNDIKKISFVLGDALSISPTLCPILLFNIIFFI